MVFVYPSDPWPSASASLTRVWWYATARLVTVAESLHEQLGGRQHGSRPTHGMHGRLVSVAVWLFSLSSHGFPVVHRINYLTIVNKQSTAPWAAQKILVNRWLNVAFGGQQEWILDPGGSVTHGEMRRNSLSVFFFSRMAELSWESLLCIGCEGKCQILPFREFTLVLCIFSSSMSRFNLI